MHLAGRPPPVWILLAGRRFDAKTPVNGVWKSLVLISNETDPGSTGFSTEN